MIDRKALAAFFVVHRYRLECLDKSQNAVNGVRSSCETLERNSDGSVQRSIRVTSMNTPNAPWGALGARPLASQHALRGPRKVENQALWSIGLNLEPLRSVPGAHQKSAVDSRVGVSSVRRWVASFSSEG